MTEPYFLLAMPQLDDLNFYHKVIFILQHDSKGAMGIVLNHPSQSTLGDYSAQNSIKCIAPLSQQRILLGGPVEVERGLILHQNETLEEKDQVIPGLYLSASQESLTRLISENSKPLLLFLGYAGWGARQLENEIAEGAWLSAPAKLKHIFNKNPDLLYEEILADMGITLSQLISGSGRH